MKKVFVASLCKNGILGGGLYVENNRITYRTNKITVPAQLKHLTLDIKEIQEISSGWLFFFPTITIHMKNHKEWKFIVFRRNEFFKTLRELGL